VVDRQGRCQHLRRPHPARDRGAEDPVQPRRRTHPPAPVRLPGADRLAAPRALARVGVEAAGALRAPVHRRLLPAAPAADRPRHAADAPFLLRQRVDHGRRHVPQAARHVGAAGRALLRQPGRPAAQHAGPDRPVRRVGAARQGRHLRPARRGDRRGRDLPRRPQQPHRVHPARREAGGLPRGRALLRGPRQGPGDGLLLRVLRALRRGHRPGGHLPTPGGVRRHVHGHGGHRQDLADPGRQVRHDHRQPEHPGGGLQPPHQRPAERLALRPQHGHAVRRGLHHRRLRLRPRHHPHQRRGRPQGPGRHHPGVPGAGRRHQRRLVPHQAGAPDRHPAAGRPLRRGGVRPAGHLLLLEHQGEGRALRPAGPGPRAGAVRRR
ncbi:hypothetical protein SVEN_1314, partial [Streptomyces venezuelae ATCC 10712]